MDTRIFRGMIPAVLTPCDEEGRPDFEALVAAGQRMMEAGMSGVVYCGSMGDWPLLDDEQRQAGVEALVEAGIPVVVGTGAQNPARSAAHAAHAARVGAGGLMVIPRVLSRGPVVAAQRAHFAAVLSAAPELPAVIYNSPYYGYQTRADLFFDLYREHPNLIGFKEFGGADSLDYAAEHITSGDEHLLLLVGVDTQVFHGVVDCGAVGVITGIGNVFPEQVLELLRLCRLAAEGDVEARRLALELDRALGVLSRFDEGPDLVLYFKHLMGLEGHEGYEHHFVGSDRLTDSQREFATAQHALFSKWWDQWPGRGHGA